MQICLTTNIIFGLSDQSQCKKCTRILPIFININNISSGNNEIDVFLCDTRLSTSGIRMVANYVNSMDMNSNPLSIYDFIERARLYDKINDIENAEKDWN